ncbi:class D sortase [Bacillus salitolerans]|uniref:Class D sortase n=1 Tax=Bacillus salitolerans TaxID=1437434 RepID=A0ABW4LT51_9BACI
MVNMLKNKISLFIMAVGAVMIISNIYTFLVGYTASSSSPSEIKTKEDVKVYEQKKVNLYYTIPVIGDKFGDLYIPKLKKHLPIYQGTSEDVLKKGIGHVYRSALPGENNHAILSGHRDTVFRNLDQLKLQDELIVRTEAGEFLYKIKKIRIVDANDRTVNTPKPKGMLTLTTCYPFQFIGPAPKRYIITSELIVKQHKKSTSP